MLKIVRDWLWLESSQWKSKEELSLAQLSKLKQTTERAYQLVPFYRALYDKAGASPPIIFSLEDIRTLPKATREQYRDAPLDTRTAKRIDASSCCQMTTSGSTGMPLTVLLESRAATYRDALNLRMLRAYGVGPLDRVCRVRGGFGREADLSARWAVKRGLWGRYRDNRYRLLFFSGNIREHLDFFLKWKPTVLIAAGSYCKTLIEASENEGEELAFKVVVTTAELSDSSTRKLIQERFSAGVFDHYANEELGSIAWECPSHAGYHVNSESSLVEVLKDGELHTEGEVHVTSFYQMATPLIRYATGDMATMTQEECPCGRGLGLLKAVQGRILDFITTGGGGRVSPIAVVAALETIRGVEQYKLTQNNDLSIDAQLRVDESNRQPATRELRSRCRILFGELPVQIRFVESIEMAGSKFRLIESHAKGPAS